MSTVTIEAIEAIKAKQTELAQMIQQLVAAKVGPTEIEIDECTIELEPGEHYAGAVLDANGQHLHHLVLMAQRPTEDLNWQAAMDWAASVGGTLPTRQEQALLFSNCKQHIEPDWHWSCEENDASYAWYCHFHHGHQNDYRKSNEGCAVAVRRIPVVTG